MDPATKCGRAYKQWTIAPGRSGRFSPTLQHLITPATVAVLPTLIWILIKAD